MIEARGRTAKLEAVADPEEDPGVQRNPPFTRSLHAKLTH